jgi:hypothetical protein
MMDAVAIGVGPEAANEATNMTMKARQKTAVPRRRSHKGKTKEM